MAKRVEPSLAGLPEGFKMTALRPLPEEWQVVRLGEVVKVRNEPVDPLSWPNMRYVGLEHIDSGDIMLKRWGSPSEVRSVKSKFYPGDVLYGKLRPYLDKAVLGEFVGMCSTDILVLQCVETRVHGGFLVNYLHTPRFIDHAVSTTTGVNHPRTSWRALSELQIPLPPLPEQQAIAYVLRTVQRAKEATEKVIAATRELKNSLMRHLFTYGPVRTGETERVQLVESEIGMMPAHWKMSRLEEVTVKDRNAIQTGPFGSQLKKSDLAHQGIKVYEQENVIHNDFDRGSDYISPDKFKSLMRFEVLPGDVLLTRVGTLGQAAVLPEGAHRGIIGSRLIKIRPDTSKVLPTFLVVAFHSTKLQSQVEAQGHGVVMKGLNTAIVKSFRVPTPPIEEQRKIVHIIQVVDQKLQAEQARKKALDTLFRTLLHHLMTGAVRVKDLPIPETEGVA